MHSRPDAAIAPAPVSLAAAPDRVSLALAVAAGLALLRFRAGVMPLIGAAALCGILLRLAGAVP